MDFLEKNVVVVGAGKSGIGAITLLHSLGANITLFDGNEKADIDVLKEQVASFGVKEVYVGNLPEEIISSTQMLVLSPGVPTDTEFVDKFRENGTVILGEIELGYQASKGKLIGITGTNGKTTTTTLVGQIMDEYFGNTFVVGNIGNPYTLEALKTTEDSVTVAEISSFQLETAIDFKPNVSAILNVTPDHLNRHHTMENYAGAKEAIAKNQTVGDTCVLNYENEYTRDFGARCHAKVVYFSSQRKLDEGYYLEGEDIVVAEDKKVEKLMNIHDMNLVGVCNVENVMAAIAIAKAMGVPYENILSTVKRFKAVEHRIEFVATKKGVDYYNDSKGTNPDAAIQGIKAMCKPTILIGGGYDKENEYDEWIEAFDGKVKLFVLIGQTREKIAACARAHGFEEIVMADTFEEAMDICIQNANPGDAVLLSPACASWGMFPNYEVRGKIFKEIVNSIEE
ncbi:MAG: UDP-N-acetylmuramoyl-L-alanine--D-glutamate ligase [Lachnospiraceae bacterium]|nr:UDP-N-acetylmuramoyl-L-alanine--D-glutamate ligase [Lachnospiraceae bacterium]